MAAARVPEIANDIVNLDRAMRWGFNWQHGPFEMIDQLGAGRLIALLEKTKTPLPNMLRVLQTSNEKNFYRNDGNEYLTTEGNWQPI